MRKVASLALLLCVIVTLAVPAAGDTIVATIPGRFAPYTQGTIGTFTLPAGYVVNSAYLIFYDFSVNFNGYANFIVDGRYVTTIDTTPATLHADILIMPIPDVIVLSGGQANLGWFFTNTPCISLDVPCTPTITIGGPGGSGHVDLVMDVGAVQQTPEPASFALLASGLLGLGRFARRRLMA